MNVYALDEQMNQKMNEFFPRRCWKVPNSPSRFLGPGELSVQPGMEM